MIINPGPQMGYSELVEMYGDELGFSLTKMVKKVTKPVAKVAKAVAKPVAKAVVKTAGVVARNPAAIATGGVSLLAPKSVQKTLNTVTKAAATGGATLALTKSGQNLVKKTAGVVARNPAAIATGGLSLLAPKSMQKTLNTAATAAATGGISLVATKSGRNLASKAVRGVQKNVLRPATHAALRSPVVSKGVGLAVRSFVPGGAAAMTAFDAAKGLAAKGKKPAPMAAKTIPLPAAIKPKAPAAPRSASGQVGQYRSPRPAAPVAPAPVVESQSPFPILPLAIGGAGLLGVLLLTMGKKK